MKTIVLLVVLLAAGYGLLSYHFILLDDSMRIIKKTHVGYENTFVDARGAKKLEILTKPELMEAGINDVIKQTTETIEQKTN